MLEFLVSALRNLGRKRFRSVLTICGIMIGVASVILIGAIGNSAKYAVNKQLDGLGINGVDISEQKSSYDDRTATLSQKDLSLCQGVNGVQAAMPLIMQQGDAVLRNMQKDALVWGIGSNAEKIISLKLLYGRMFSPSQVEQHAKVCLVGNDFAQEIYHRDNIVGKTVSVYLGDRYETLKVCGIVESDSSLLYNLVGDYIPTFLYTPYTTASDLREYDGFDEIMVKSSASTAGRVGDNIVQLLSSKHPGKSFIASNMLEQKKKLSGILSMITLVVSAFGGISLVVAGLGIMTVMLVSLNERTREIGIKKALGAKKGAIMLEFLLEAMVISCIGSAAGISLGVGLSFLLSRILNLHFGVDFFTILLSCGFALVTGILFGVYPAVKAARLNPVEALRHD